MYFSVFQNIDEKGRFATFRLEDEEELNFEQKNANLIVELLSFKNDSVEINEIANLWVHRDASFCENGVHRRCIVVNKYWDFIEILDFAENNSNQENEMRVIFVYNLREQRGLEPFESYKEHSESGMLERENNIVCVMNNEGKKLCHKD